MSAERRGDDAVDSYSLDLVADASGPFVTPTALNMPAGAAIDAASGDFLFSVLDGSAVGTDEVHLWAVRGFVFE